MKTNMSLKYLALGAASSLAMTSAAQAQQAVFGSVNLDSSAVVTIDQATAATTNASLTEVMQISGMQDADNVNDEMMVIDSVTGYIRKLPIPSGVSNAVDATLTGATVTDTAGTTLTVGQSGNDLTFSDGTETFTYTPPLGPWDDGVTGDPATQSSGDITYTAGKVNIGTLDVSNVFAQSIAQGASDRRAQGSLSVPWIYSTAIEAPDEKSATSTMIVLGQDGNYNPASDTISLVTSGELRFSVATDGSLDALAYGAGTFTDAGNEAFLLAVDANGNIIETALPSVSTAVNDATLTEATFLGTDGVTVTVNQSGDDLNFSDGTDTFTFTDNHLGTVDQTLTGTRQVVLDGNELSFVTDQKDFVFQPTSGTIYFRGENDQTSGTLRVEAGPVDLIAGRGMNLYSDYDAGDADGTGNALSVFANGDPQDVGGATRLMRLHQDGSLNLTSYGDGNITGTETFLLAVDVDGNVIETALPSAVANSVDVVDGTSATFTDTAGGSVSVTDVAGVLTFSDGTDTFTFTDDHLGAFDQTLTGTRLVDLNGSNLNIRGTAGGLTVRDDGLIVVDSQNSQAVDVIENTGGDLALQGAKNVDVIIDTNQNQTPNAVQFRVAADGSAFLGEPLTDLFVVRGDGRLTADSYGSGTYSAATTGVADAYMLTVDADGNIQEAALPASLASVNDATATEATFTGTDGVTVTVSQTGDDLNFSDGTDTFTFTDTNLGNTDLAQTDALRTYDISGDGGVTTTNDLAFMNGNIGIGTTTPAFSLDIDGSARLSDQQSYRIAGTTGSGEAGLRLHYNSTRLDGVSVIDTIGSAFQIRGETVLGAANGSTERFEVSMDNGTVRMCAGNKVAANTGNADAYMLTVDASGNIQEAALPSVSTAVNDATLTGATFLGTDGTTVTVNQTGDDLNFSDGTDTFTFTDNHLGTVDQTLTGNRIVDQGVNNLNFNSDVGGIQFTANSDIEFTSPLSAGPNYIRTQASNLVLETEGNVRVVADANDNNNDPGRTAFSIAANDTNVGTPTELFSFNQNGSADFVQYGNGTFTDAGNEAYLLAVDASGNVIETALPTQAASSSDVTPTGATFTDTAGATVGIAQSGGDLTFTDGTDTFTFTPVDTAIGNTDQEQTAAQRLYDFTATGSALTFEKSGVNDDILVIDGDNGRVGIGMDAPTEALQVAGNVYVAGNILNPSDSRLKRNIADYDEGLDVLDAIRTVSYEYNGQNGTIDGQEKVGIIAQELAAVAPEMVHENGGFLSVDQQALTYLTINAVQDLKDQNEAVVEQVTVLEEQNSALAAQNDLLLAKAEQQSSEIEALQAQNAELMQLAAAMQAQQDQMLRMATMLNEMQAQMGLQPQLAAAE